MTKRATIKDIAHELNISTSTVSRALADQWDVNPDTRRAVLEVAKRLNYRSNPISLRLRSRQTWTVGVVVPEFINSYFAEILIGMQRVFFPKGYNILVAQSNETASVEENNLKLFENNMVDGILISVAQDSDNTAIYDRLLKNDIPLVFFNRVPEDIRASKVIVDDRKWAFLATEHLISQGCRRIAHFAGNGNLSVSVERRHGYISALKKHGLPVDESLIIEAGLQMESGYIGAMKLLQMDPLPDGLFAVTDPVAIGAMKFLKNHGIRIPEDIAVAGFTESPYATIVEPPLTTVRQPTFDIGVTAATLLLDQITSRHDPDKSDSWSGDNVRTVTLEAHLEVRESSLCKNFRGGEAE